MFMFNPYIKRLCLTLISNSPKNIRNSARSLGSHDRQFFFQTCNNFANAISEEDRRDTPRGRSP